MYRKRGNKRTNERVRDHSYACAMWVDGDMNPTDSIEVCKDRQGGRYMMRHIVRIPPLRNRLKSTRISGLLRNILAAKNDADNA